MEKNTNIENSKTGYLAESKVSKSNNNKGKSFTYSTVIPKPIVNKFGLDKGRKLYWDINELSIVITPELPEDKSIQAGYDMLTDILERQQGTFYSGNFVNIINWLDMDKPENEKIKHFKKTYKEFDEVDKTKYVRLLTYLLDYPLTPEAHRILKEAYNQITQTD